MSTDSAVAVRDRLARHVSYQALVGRLRELIHRMVPPGATVLVVSKGDADLVSLVGRQGWHFPQDDRGGYAGYHPKDSAAAIEELEALRSRGADFLVLPATASWWLEHYADFGNHLRLNYETLVEEPDTGVIYSLRRAQAHMVAEAGFQEDDLEQHRRTLLVQQINDLAAQLVPPERAVVVADSQDAATVQLEGRVTMHLSTTGAHTSASGVGLVNQMESLRRQGAACLIITHGAFDWWGADEVFRSYVEQQYRCITKQAHVCLIYELDPIEKAVT